MSNTVRLTGQISPKPGFKFVTAGCGITIEIYSGITLLGTTFTTVDANGRGDWMIDLPQQTGTKVYQAKVVAAGCAEAGVYDDYSVSFNTDSCNPSGLVCGINWSLSNPQFTAGVSEVQTLSANGIPAGCVLIFELFNGPGATLPEPFGQVVLSSAKTQESNALTFPSFAIGTPYEYRPKLPLVGPCAVCAIYPLVFPFAIVAAGAPPAAGACGAVINASCVGGQITVAFTNAAACAGKQITIVPSAGTVNPSFFNLPGSASGNAAFAVSGGVAATTYQVKLDGVNVGAPITNCVAAAGPPPPPPAPSTNLCTPGTFENGSSAAFPVTWRESAVTPEYAQVVTTQFTNTTPGVVSASIPFTILPGATSLGASSMPFILEGQGIGGATAVNTKASISRNRCDYTAAAGITYPLGTLLSHNNTFSVNDASLAGGGEFNLTTGQWFYNVELPAGLVGGYNHNRAFDFHWYA